MKVFRQPFRRPHRVGSRLAPLRLARMGCGASAPVAAAPDALDATLEPVRDEHQLPALAAAAGREEVSELQSEMSAEGNLVSVMGLPWFSTLVGQ